MVLYSGVSSSVDGLFPCYFDVVVYGDGGAASIYLLGLYDVLKKLEKKGVFKYITSGVASILSVLLCSNVSKEKMIDFCVMMFDNVADNKWKTELLKILPENAYSMCCKRVYIYTLSMYSHRPMVFSLFHSNRDVVEACSLSFHKPYNIKDYNGCPRQLTIRLDKLEEKKFGSQKQFFQYYKDIYMKKLIQKAQNDADEFFSHPTSTSSDNLLKWRICCGVQSKKKNHMIFCCFIPSVIILFLIFRKRFQ